ncbi:hypothetical protein [Aestuariimicrobium ganziense]|nr:hypothetical protein [Aestuariimicrobium ganziense]
MTTMDLINAVVVVLGTLIVLGCAAAGWLADGFDGRGPRQA